MKINGKKLAWAIIHFTIFICFFFSDINMKISTVEELLIIIFNITIMWFFAWRFIENMGESFK